MLPMCYFKYQYILNTDSIIWGVGLSYRSRVLTNFPSVTNTTRHLGNEGLADIKYGSVKDLIWVHKEELSEEELEDTIWLFEDRKDKEDQLTSWLTLYVS